MVRDIKAALLRHPTLRRGWGHYRARDQARAYVQRRENYEELAAHLNVQYSRTDSIRRVRERLASRGYVPVKKSVGAVHTFLWTPSMSWHEALVPDLRELGEVSRFDYTSLGFSKDVLHLGNKQAPSLREKASEVSFSHLAKVNRSNPVDWVFVYANGREIERSWPTKVANELGIPVVNMCLDDKHRWEGDLLGLQRTGQVDIASAFDLTWTSSRIATTWYLVEGGVPIYMPEGFDASRCWPETRPKDVNVGFVGGAYGFRPLVVDELRRRGVSVVTKGAGWSSGMVSAEEIRRLFSRCTVNLGMGGVGYDAQFTTLKGRDFDIPGTGGGMYLTSYNAELAKYFQIGSEIDCYGNVQELIELARHYIRNPEEARSMSAAARTRALREHRWLHRYEEILNILGILDGKR